MSKLSEEKYKALGFDIADAIENDKSVAVILSSCCTAPLGLRETNGVIYSYCTKCNHAVYDDGQRTHPVPVPELKEPYVPLPKHPEYLCFHCKQVFTGDKEAREHFGPSCQCKPLCQITREEWEENQRLLREYREEDADIHRQMLRLKDTHALELRQEEEKGYARGLRDGRLMPDKSTPL